jgi:peptidoglycan/xylan/chitin deacetylase (PgdA/CDA1 family)
VRGGHAARRPPSRTEGRAASAPAGNPADRKRLSTARGSRWAERVARRGARSASADPCPPTAAAAPPPDPGTGLSQVYERGSSGRREIALTFDAGADRGNGEAILDRLAVYGVPASFGVTGQWAEANPDLIRRMIAEGHTVFNHTWSHRSWTGRSTSPDPEDNTTWEPLPSEERIIELKRTEEVILDSANYDVRPFFRPSYGDLDSAALGELADAGYMATVMWSCESFAWKGWTAEEIVAYCTTDMAPGDIILLHVGAQGADYDALPGLIEGLRAQGFAFVTIEQILQP